MFHKQGSTMKTSIRVLCLGSLLAVSAVAGAQTYGPKDEGRRFNDGSKVVCHNVEVQRNSKDPNRITGTATGAVATRWAAATARSWPPLPVPWQAAQPGARSRATSSPRTVTAWSSVAVSVSTVDRSLSRKPWLSRPW